MKLRKFVPCSRSMDIQALLSRAAETWQSVQDFVSRARTVCGTNVENAWPLKPSAETVCCVLYSHSRFAFCELTRIAHEDRAGATRCPVTVPSTPSMYPSSRSTWKL